MRKYIHVQRMMDGCMDGWMDGWMDRWRPQTQWRPFAENDHHISPGNRRHFRPDDFPAETRLVGYGKFVPWRVWLQNPANFNELRVESFDAHAAPEEFQSWTPGQRAFGGLGVRQDVKTHDLFFEGKMIVACLFYLKNKRISWWIWSL